MSESRVSWTIKVHEFFIYSYNIISFDFNYCSNLVSFVLIQINFDVKFQKKIKKNVEKPSKARQGSKAKGTEHSNSRCENFARWNSRCKNSFQGAKPLNENFVHPYSRCEIPSWHTSAISHTSRSFSHTSIQGAKFIPRFEILFSRCEFSRHHFRTPLFKVRKFSHRAKHPPGTLVPFRTPQAKFHTVRNKVRNFSTVQN